jgi:hypothetical protein
MKKSQLKEAIKAEIKSVLSEEITEAKFVKFKGDSDDMKMKVEGEREMNTPDGELKVYRVKTDDGVQSYTADQVELVEEDLNEVYQTRSKMEQIVDLFQDMMDDEYDGVPYPKVLNRLVKFIDDDYKAAERDGEKFTNIREAKSAADVDKEVKDLKAKMIEKAKEFKKAEGKAKDKIKDELKAMTVKKSDLEKKVEDLKKKEEKEAEDIGRGQELDT